MEYKLIDRTPKEMLCVGAYCPRIYEECIGAACPTKVKIGKSYFIVGTQIDPKEVVLENGQTLEGKVGKGEVLIKVPKELIDEMRR